MLRIRSLKPLSSHFVGISSTTPSFQHSIVLDRSYRTSKYFKALFTKKDPEELEKEANADGARQLIDSKYAHDNVRADEIARYKTDKASGQYINEDYEQNQYEKRSGEVDVTTIRADSEDRWKVEGNTKFMEPRGFSSIPSFTKEQLRIEMDKQLEKQKSQKFKDSLENKYDRDIRITSGEDDGNAIYDASERAMKRVANTRAKVLKDHIKNIKLLAEEAQQRESDDRSIYSKDGLAYPEAPQAHDKESLSDTKKMVYKAENAKMVAYEHFENTFSKMVRSNMDDPSSRSISSSDRQRYQSIPESNASSKYIIGEGKSVVNIIDSLDKSRSDNSKSVYISVALVVSLFGFIIVMVFTISSKNEAERASFRQDQLNQNATSASILPTMDADESHVPNRVSKFVSQLQLVKEYQRLGLPPDEIEKLLSIQEAIDAVDDLSPDVHNLENYPDAFESNYRSSNEPLFVVRDESF